MNRTNRSNFIFAVLFVSLCSLSLLGAFVSASDRGAALNEKRELAAMPVSGQTTWADWPPAFETWFDDHFGYRSWLVRVNSLFRYRLFNMSSSRAVLPGQSDWLYYDGNSVRGGAPRRNHLAQLPVDYRQIFQALKEQYEYNDRYFAAQGRTYLIVIVPDKWSVYAERLPASVGAPAAQTSADLFLAYLRAETNLKILDLKQHLRANVAQLGPLYHQIDSHWNQLGAYVAAQEVARFIGQYDNRLEYPGPVPDISWQARTHGDLTALMGLEGWLQEYEPILAAGEMPVFEQTDLPGPANSASAKRFPIHTHRDRPDLAKLLVLRDSYGDGLLPWLSPSFQDVRWVWTSNVRRIDIQPLIDEVDPDLVIEEKAEKYLMFPIRFFTAPGRSAVRLHPGKKN